MPILNLLSFYIVAASEELKTFIADKEADLGNPPSADEILREVRQQ